MNTATPQNKDSPMSDEQLRALWQKTDAHAQAIGNLDGRTQVLEHQARMAEASIHRMLERTEAQSSRLDTKFDTISDEMRRMFATINKTSGASDFARWALPVLLSAIAVGVTLWGLK